MSRPQDAIPKLSRGESVEVAQKDGESASGEALPEGWADVTLGDVTSHSKEKAQPDEFGDRAYIGLEHIEGDSNDIIGFGDIATVKSTKSVFHEGDVLYGKLRPYLRKVCRPDFAGVCSTDILVFPQVDHLDNGYLLYFLSQDSTSEYATQNAKGINLPRISAKTLAEIGFPLPPKAEQSRIVSAIESLQERSSRARVLLSEVGPLIGQLRQSVLRDAFSGKLTADWRAQHARERQGASRRSDDADHSDDATNPRLAPCGSQDDQATNPAQETASELLLRIRTERRERWQSEQLAKYEAKGKQPPKNWESRYKEAPELEEVDLPEIPDGWIWTSADDVCSQITDGEHIQPRYQDSGFPMLTAKHVRDGYVTFKDAGVIAKDDFERCLARCAPTENDILIVSVGATTGRSAIVTKCDPFALVRSVLLLRPILHPRYLLAWTKTPWCFKWMTGASGATAQAHLYITATKRMPVPIPPLEEQIEITRQVDEMLEFLDGVAASIASMESSLTQLDQSILSKAFRGELVPQDPTEEPASELLARIRTTREKLEAEKKVSKKKATQNKSKKKSTRKAKA